MERKSAPVGEAGESSEGGGRPKPGPVGDVRLCRQLWLGAVRPSKVSFVHPRVKGTFIPNEFGGSHFRSPLPDPSQPDKTRDGTLLWNKDTKFLAAFLPALKEKSTPK